MHTRLPLLRWLSVSVALVLVLSGIGPAGSARAAGLAALRLSVISPQPPICENNAYSYLVTVISGAGRVPPYRSYPNVWVDALVLDQNVGFVTPARQSGILSQGLSDFVEVAAGQMNFTFHSKKAGTTSLRLSFKDLDGRVITTELPVTVEHCEVEITSMSTWEIPGPAKLGLAASIHRAPMNADDQGHLTGRATVKWFLVTRPVDDCAGDIQLVSENVADLSGQLGPDGQVTVNVFYQPTEINLADTCTNPEGSIAGDRRVLVDLAPLELTFPASGGSVTVAHEIIAPERTPGSAIVVVHPVTP